MKSRVTSKSRSVPGAKRGSGKSASIAVLGSAMSKDVPVAGGEMEKPAYEICFEDKCTTLTVEDLTIAIRNGIDREGMPQEQARGMAQHVLNFFGYSERIIDNILEPEDRDAFYQLEDTGILTTEREETTLYDGREWRIHYWLFRKERILELLNNEEGMASGLEASFDYGEVPEEIWQRTK